MMLNITNQNDSQPNLFSPVKTAHAGRRTRAQRLQKPDPNPETKLGASSSQKRVTDYVNSNSPRI